MRRDVLMAGLPPLTLSQASCPSRKRTEEFWDKLDEEAAANARTANGYGGFDSCERAQGKGSELCGEPVVKPRVRLAC